jgi:hypothetical protein
LTLLTRKFSLHLGHGSAAILSSFMKNASKYC